MTYKNIKENLSVNKININGVLFYVDEKNENIHQCEYVKFTYPLLDKHGKLLRNQIVYTFNVAQVKYNTLRNPSLKIFLTYEDALKHLKKVIAKHADRLSEEIVLLNEDLLEVNQAKERIISRLQQEEQALEDLNKKIVLF